MGAGPRTPRRGMAQAPTTLIDWPHPRVHPSCGAIERVNGMADSQCSHVIPMAAACPPQPESGCADCPDCHNLPSALHLIQNGRSGMGGDVGIPPCHVASFPSRTPMHVGSEPPRRGARINMISAIQAQPNPAASKQPPPPSLPGHFLLCEDCGGFWRKLNNVWTIERMQHLTCMSDRSQEWTCDSCKGVWQTAHVGTEVFRGYKSHQMLEREGWWFIGGQVSYRGATGIRTHMVGWPGMNISDDFFTLTRGRYLGAHVDCGHPDFYPHHFTADHEWCPHIGEWGGSPQSCPGQWSDGHSKFLWEGAQFDQYPRIPPSSISRMFKPWVTSPP